MYIFGHEHYGPELVEDKRKTSPFPKLAILYKHSLQAPSFKRTHLRTFGTVHLSKMGGFLRGGGVPGEP